VSDTRTCANCDTELAAREHRGEDIPYCPGCDYWWTERLVERVLPHVRPVPEGARVSLVYEPNGTSHSDLVLRVDGWAHRSDSYYYGLDHPQGQPDDPKSSLRALLTQWRQSVADAKQGVAFHLPHDFSDQHTGWLRATLDGEDIELVQGWSATQGFCLFPSDHGDTARALADFKPVDDAQPITIARDALIADIDRSLESLAALD
jgi:Zn-finger nucleic acid-binding protein